MVVFHGFSTFVFVSMVFSHFSNGWTSRVVAMRGDLAFWKSGHATRGYYRPSLSFCRRRETPAKVPANLRTNKLDTKMLLKKIHLSFGLCSLLFWSSLFLYVSLLLCLFVGWPFASCFCFLILPVSSFAFIGVMVCTHAKEAEKYPKASPNLLPLNHTLFKVGSAPVERKAQFPFRDSVLHATTNPHWQAPVHTFF